MIELRGSFRKDSSDFEVVAYNCWTRSFSWTNLKIRLWLPVDRAVLCPCRNRISQWRIVIYVKKEKKIWIFFVIAMEWLSLRACRHSVNCPRQTLSSRIPDHNSGPPMSRASSSTLFSLISRSGISSGTTTDGAKRKTQKDRSKTVLSGRCRVAGGRAFGRSVRINCK